MVLNSSITTSSSSPLSPFAVLLLDRPDCRGWLRTTTARPARTQPLPLVLTTIPEFLCCQPARLTRYLPAQTPLLYLRGPLLPIHNFTMTVLQPTRIVTLHHLHREPAVPNRGQMTGDVGGPHLLVFESGKSSSSERSRNGPGDSSDTHSSPESPLPLYIYSLLSYLVFDNFLAGPNTDPIFRFCNPPHAIPDVHPQS